VSLAGSERSARSTTGLASIERVLVVCTANRCRSPLAAALLRELLARGHPHVRVGSAGFGDAGAKATAHTIEAGNVLGLDLTEHRSRVVARSLLRRADLILGMERLHVRELVVLDPRTWPRAFTLKELVRRGETHGPRRPDETLREWAIRQSSGRQRNAMLGMSSTDDLTDPTGGDAADHERAAGELGDLLNRLVRLAWPA
jgi:protein-tyrosine phosphatase